MAMEMGDNLAGHFDKIECFANCCRICLDIKATVSIFENKLVRNNITICAGIKVKFNDRLPKNVCRTCFYIITKIVELREKARIAKETLWNLVGLPLIEKEDFVHTTLEVGTNTEDQISDSDKNQRDENQNISKKNGKTTSEAGTNTEIDDSVKSKKLKNNTSKNYECTICNKGFKAKSSYYIHKRTHDKSKCYLCPVCEKQFIIRHDLIKHERTHTGEKPYKCEICSKKFGQRCTLNGHIKNVHRKKKGLTLEYSNSNVSNSNDTCNLGYHAKCDIPSASCRF